MNAISYKQLRAFAAQYGAVVGLMWIVSFAFYIIGLTRPLVGNVGLIIGLLVRGDSRFPDTEVQR